MSELNRTPFDLPEAESELVAGYHVEYSGFRFAFFMLSEYVYVYAIAALTTVLFLGGWHAPVAISGFHSGNHLVSAEVLVYRVFPILDPGDDAACPGRSIDGAWLEGAAAAAMLQYVSDRCLHGAVY